MSVSCVLNVIVLCRPYKDLEATTRAKGRPKDGRGDQVSTNHRLVCRGWGATPTDIQPSDKIVIDAVEAVAAARGVTMAEVALAWSLQNKWVTAPIVGIRSTERLDELLRALDLELSKEDIEKLESGYVPVNVRGHV